MPPSTKTNPVGCDVCLPELRVKIVKVVGKTAASPNPVRPASDETVIRLLPTKMTALDRRAQALAHYAKRRYEQLAPYKQLAPRQGLLERVYWLVGCIDTRKK
jgi:hypothetical protein